MSFLKKILLGLALVGFCSSLAYAKDISDEQYQVRVAQKEYDNANRDYEVLTQQIEQVEKRLSQLNTQLESLKRGLPAKEERLNKAKANLDEKTKILGNIVTGKQIGRASCRERV